MNYTEPLINQVYRFSLAVGFGVIMAVIYETFSFVRIIFESRKVTFICDIIFSVVFTVMSFFFMIVYNDGEARFNLVAAQLLGLVSFHIAFGKYLLSPFRAMSEKVRNKLNFKLKRNKN